MVTREASEPIAIGELSVSGGTHVGVGQRNVEFVRHDLAQHRHRALAHVGFAAVDEDAAIFVDLDNHGRAVPVADRASCR